jgi:porphyrinogen peroxidase
MSTPQPGIFSEESRHHHFLEYTIPPGAAAGDLRGALARALADRTDATGGATHVVAAFGARLWKELSPAQVPDGLRPFAAIEGKDGRTAPATPRDLWIWIHGAGIDRVFDRALSAHRAIAGLARLELELSGFTYFDSRDLTGFVDGSANPRGDQAREAALVPSGSAGECGSFVMTQRWIHDLASFHALPVAEQERVIGRTKADSVEMEGDALPRTSHVSRTDVVQEGRPIKIYRRSVPFGSVREHGLYFVAFGRDLGRFDVLLRRMFGVAEDGIRDRLTDYSRPTTGSYWFAPSQEDLSRLLKGAS